MKKSQNSIIILFIVFVSTVLTGCNKRVPSDVIQPKQMEALLYDYHIARSMADELPASDRYKQSLYTESVFKKYNTTEADFDSSMVWYARNTDQLSKIYKNINTRYKKEQQELDSLFALQENKPSFSIAGDTVDVWYQRRVQLLTSYSFNNKINFVIPTDTNYKPQDQFVWKMRYTFIPMEKDSLAQDSALMALSIRFANDSLINTHKKVLFSGIDSLVLASDSLYELKEVKGFIYYLGLDPQKEVLIDDMRLMRYHRSLTDSLDQIEADTISSIPVTSEENVEEVIMERNTGKVAPSDIQEVIIDTLTPQVAPVRRSPQEMREGSRRSSNSAN